jgi:hypothetical protein
MKRIIRVAPFFAFGPISGPLMAGVVFNFREGRPVLAAMYAVALVEVFFLLPALIVHFGAMIR